MSYEIVFRFNFCQENFVLCAYENHSVYERVGVGGHWPPPTCALRRSPRPTANGVVMIRAQRVVLLKALLAAVRTDLRARGNPPPGSADSWNPFRVSSADERFDATFHTNVLVNSSGYCQYLPPGKIRFLCPPIVTQFKPVQGASPDGADTSAILGLFDPQPLLLSFPLCLQIFPEHDNAIFLFFVLGSWLKLSLPICVICPYCVPSVL